MMTDPVAATANREPLANERPLDASLRGYLETNADIVTRITKTVHIDDIGALSAQSDMPIVFENIFRKAGLPSMRHVREEPSLAGAGAWRHAGQLS
jgi:hypothetical protein